MTHHLSMPRRLLLASPSALASLALLMTVGKAVAGRGAGQATAAAPAEPTSSRDQPAAAPAATGRGDLTSSARPGKRSRP